MPSTTDTHGLLHEVIDAAVERAPDTTAVVMAGDSLTYAELDQLTDRVAAALTERGAGPGDRVCLLTPKSPATIAAMLGTMRAGCVYVPVDVTAPFPRLAGIVAAADPAALVVLDDGADVARQLVDDGTLGSGVPAIDVVDLPDAGGFVRETGIDPASTAHIIFTSGSTGAPKGVRVSHASVRAFVDWATHHFAMQPGAHCSGLPPLYFDLSTFDVYCTLAAGGELHLMPPDVALPRQIADYIAQSELDQLVCVPSTLAFISVYGALPESGFPSLRRVICCGEVLSGPVLGDWMDRNPGAQFTNLYGPTEATVASTYHTITERPSADAPPVPIGVACAGEEILVLGDDGTETLDGETGELCIAGVGLSRGYWRAPELTAAAFVPDPRSGRDGEIYRTGDLGRRDEAGVHHYVGRRDNQIKHRGFRIELGEIETAVTALPAVAECAVLAAGADNFAGNVICCAVVLRPGEPTDVEDLRPDLASHLPGYMLPTRWLAVDALPRNANGKVDRVALQRDFVEHAPGLGSD